MSIFVKYSPDLGEFLTCSVHWKILIFSLPNSDDQINAKQFTKKRNKNSTKLTLCNNYFQDGSTCAHIAAAKGSLGVVEELMKHDLNVVLNSRNKVTDSTPLHIATEGGHFDVVKKLLDAGASAADENKAGKKCRVLLK